MSLLYRKITTSLILLTGSKESWLDVCEVTKGLLFHWWVFKLPARIHPGLRLDCLLAFPSPERWESECLDWPIIMAACFSAYLNSPCNSHVQTMTFWPLFWQLFPDCFFLFTPPGMWPTFQPCWSVLITTPCSPSTFSSIVHWHALSLHLSVIAWSDET